MNKKSIKKKYNKKKYKYSKYNKKGGNYTFKRKLSRNLHQKHNLTFIPSSSLF
jgi:hypothetical protein